MPDGLISDASWNTSSGTITCTNWRRNEASSDLTRRGVRLSLIVSHSGQPTANRVTMKINYALLIQIAENRHLVPQITHGVGLWPQDKFQEMVNRDEVLRKLLQYWPVTVFAPTNDAIEKSNEWIVGRENKVVSYHVLNQVAEKTTFPFKSPTSLAGSPPLYLSVKEGPGFWKVSNGVLMAHCLSTSLTEPRGVSL
ncbi:fasciclin-1 [Trichonephila clavipes]|nr:fasciclin-1 [Trichonephila clavipes]